MDDQTPGELPPIVLPADENVPAVIPVEGSSGSLPDVLPVSPAEMDAPAVVPVTLAPAEDRSWVAFIFGLLLVAAAFGYIALWLIPGESRKIATAGLESLPFLGLALLAYLSDRYDAGRVVTIIYWMILIGLTGLGVAMLAAIAVMDPAAIGPLKAGRPANGLFLPGGALLFGASFLGIVLAGLVSLFAFTRPVRRFFAQMTPLDPDSFVHATALATVLAVTAICTVPLIVIGHPPLLEFFSHFQNHPLMEEMSKEDQLRDSMYALVWLVPAGILAVGFPLVRSLPQALNRVGLVVPSLGQVIFALLATGIMVVGMTFVDMGITNVFKYYHWPTTDGKAFEELMKASISPLGAVVIGITAGLGEELTVRGVLQPRMGIWLSNLFFAALHALQYNFDALLSVFLIGIILGCIRRWTNTTTTALIHGLYDFVLVYMTYKQFDLAEYFKSVFGGG